MIGHKEVPEHDVAISAGVSGAVFGLILAAAIFALAVL